MPEHGRKYFCLVYNQHQPYYKNATADRYEQPWVRLHATKDYYDMAAIMEDFPEVHVTISLSLSLMEQINDYLERLYDYADPVSPHHGNLAYYPWGALDRHLDLLMTPVDQWSAADKAFCRDHFFAADPTGQILCFEGYRYLYEKKAAGAEFSDQDYRDLKVWYHLGWTDHIFLAGEVRLLGNKAKANPLPFTAKCATHWSADELRTAPARLFDVTFRHQLADEVEYLRQYERYRLGVSLSLDDLESVAALFRRRFDGSELPRRETVALVKELMKHGVGAGYGNSGFTEQQCRELVLEQYKIMKYVIPVHRRMQQRLCADGQPQVDVATAAHIIAPLIMSTDSAKESDPGLPLPQPPFEAPQDVEWHLTNAMEFYQKEFGHKPTTLWPGESAVSERTIKFFKDAGVKVILSGREVAERSGRYGDSTLMYRVDRNHKHLGTSDFSDALSIVFRTPDDMIGFKFGANRRNGAPDGADAAWVVLNMVKSIQHWNGVPADRDMIVVNPLDGDNCWQCYSNDGVDFLRALYGALQDPRTGLATTTPAAFLASHPIEEQWELEPLATGSWVGGSLATWIGEEPENDAWTRLRMTREAVVAAGVPQPPAGMPAPNPATHRREYFEYMAWRAVFAAEISCWFWWAGDDQDSGNDAYFSEAQRTHLANAYVFARQAGYSLPYPSAQIAPLHPSPRRIEVPPLILEPRIVSPERIVAGASVCVSVEVFTEDQSRLASVELDLTPIGGACVSMQPSPMDGKVYSVTFTVPSVAAGRKKLVIRVRTKSGAENLDYLGLDVTEGPHSTRRSTSTLDVAVSN